MKVIYLHHSGFIVQLNNNTLIFDDITNIQPQFLRKGRQNYFFASHSHHDHFAQRIFSYGTDFNATYILSDDIPPKGGSNVFYVSPYQTKHFEDPKCGVVDIETYGSTDLGVSFLVKAEGKIIFHAGDLNWWDWDPETRPDIDPKVEEEDYKAEIDSLVQKYPDGAIDLAFVPVDSRLGHSAFKAAEYFIDTLHPKVLAPMHFWDHYDIGHELQNKVFGKGTQICDITRRNELIYED
ncbi:MAG: MBL fold metallo-hydrolase [Eubacteriaceae bacterium]|nr:MBL fold metallo-hydrolase [Eubacteriaceae bacterium]MDD4508102.1 MBL fold metallo-hydrolase [Eubacteriaceae bacterium]